MPKGVPLRKSRRPGRAGRPPKKTMSQNIAPTVRAPTVREATLGIDIGSHRTRICLWMGSNLQYHVVENPYSFNVNLTCYPGDFPSAVYVFDPPPAPLYLVDDEDSRRMSVSAKYVFYVLANASDTLLEQYPHVHHLMERKDDVEFRARLREAMVALLSVLHDRTMAVCRSKNIRITKIGLTIPVQWTLEFEEVYRGLVSEVFTMNPEAIYFYTETEALARYLYKHHAADMDPRDRHNTILFFDYGGHNMNGCVFGVARDDINPESNGFFRVAKAFGSGGGSEQWEHHIGEWFSRVWEQMTSSPPPPEYREEVLFRFRRQRGIQSDRREDINLTFPRPGDGYPWRATLTLETIQTAWRKGLSKPLTVAARQVAQLANMTETDSERVSKPLVVVSGGTARNPGVRSRMVAICEGHGIPVRFTDDFDTQITYDSAKIARAAAYVVSENLTIEQFFARGAAIGIQMKQAPEQGKPKGAVRLWDNSGAVLLENTNRSNTVEMSVRYRDEFRLICDPFFQRLPLQHQGWVNCKRSYDVLYLGKRKQGTWKFSLSLSGSGNNMQLLLKQDYKQRKELEWTAMKTLRLPVYYDGNSSCIHVGERNKTIAELGLGLPRQPDGGDTSSSELESDTEEEEEGEEEGGGDGGDSDSLDGPEIAWITVPPETSRNRGVKPQCSLAAAGAFIPCE